MSGFGQGGPERQTAAFDGAGFALCDAIGGMTGALALASALFQRTQTGKGQLVDVAMLDAAPTFLGPQVAEYTVTGHRHRQFGNLSSAANPTLGTGVALTRLPRTAIRGSAPSPARRERGCKAQGVQSESPSPAVRERGDQPARAGWVRVCDGIFCLLTTIGTRKPTGNRFAAGEGHLMLAVMTDRQFEKLMHGSRTRRRCARSSSRRWRPPTPRPGKPA